MRTRWLEITLLHAISDACQLANRLENVVAQRQGQQQRQQPGQHNHQPERMSDGRNEILPKCRGGRTGW
jgi:hypothetical protein